MSVSLSRQIRLTLEGVQSLSLTELLLLVDDFVIECSSSPERDVLLFQFEDELQTICNHALDRSSLIHTEIFLAVLYHLSAVLSSTSIISTWFDLILRPALRETKLPTAATNHAKELIISALSGVDPGYPEKVLEFRCHLLDLYLLDAFHEVSGNDYLELARLDPEQREKQKGWKENLEDILLRFGAERPEDFMLEIHNSFAIPSSRLQLLILLDLFASRSSFSSAAVILANHPLMGSLLHSLLLDKSPSLCTISLSLLMKLLPVLAIGSCEQLKVMLPSLLAVLARVLCWRETPSSLFTSSLQENEFVTDAEIEQELEIQAERTFDIRPDLRWDRLDRAFGSATPKAPPSPRPLFTILYYLFPCNVLRFLRNPLSVLIANGFESPYAAGWEERLDEDEIRSKSEDLLRSCVCHTSLIWRDAAAELSEAAYWAEYDVARIVSEAKMLNVMDAALGIREKMSQHVSVNLTSSPTISKTEERTIRTTAHSDGERSPSELEDGRTSPAATISLFDSQELISFPTIAPIDLSSRRPRISLQDMIATSIALKSDIDITIDGPLSWPSGLFPKTVSSPAKSNIPLPSDSIHQPEIDVVPTHVSRAIASLQREVLLLRNELNVEQWLSRENVKHIGRLYQNRILTKNAETEQQGLYNKLRNYRAQVVSLDRELKDHKEQASSTKTKFADWNTELMQKLRDVREEKKSWSAEAAALRRTEKEAQAQFTAQGRLLAEATNKVFELQTQIKETEPKITRLKDYEKEIEQYIKIQSLYDEDFKKFNERAEQMNLMKSQYKQMELHIDSYREAQAELEDKLRAQRRQTQALEAQLALANQKIESSRQIPASEIAAFAAERASMTQTNRKLMEENIELKEKEVELQAMIEVLKGQVSGRRGVVSDPPTSPLLG